MPIYEYECDEGHTFEMTQSVKGQPFAKCQRSMTSCDRDEDGEHDPHFDAYDEHPTCRWCGTQVTWCKAPCRRLISKSSFVLKGNGWTGKSS